MLHSKFSLFLLVSTLVFSLLLHSHCSASGFAVYTQGASALSQADSTIAHSDKPSCIFFNPALMNELETATLQAGVTALYPDKEFESSSSGKTFESDATWFFPATFYAVHPVNKKLSLGVGVFNPFGLGNDWPDDWEGRYIATESRLTTINCNPAASYRLTPYITLAAGIDYLYLDTTLEKKVALSPFPDGHQEFDGDGDGWGYNLGLLVDISQDVALGVSYRSEIDVDIDGDVQFDLPTKVLQSMLPDTDASSSLTLPQQIHAGLSYTGLDPFTFEIGLRWEGWSSFDELRIDFDKQVAKSKQFVTPRNWDDTWTGNIGMQYQLNEWLSLAAGYQYQGNPIPDDTFDPTITDADKHLLTTGADLTFGHMTLSVAYAFQTLEERTKNNYVDDNPSDGVFHPERSANGKYDSDLHMLAMSLTYMF
jgi:long-chain fatty acid transport protein